MKKILTALFEYIFSLTKAINLQTNKNRYKHAFVNIHLMRWTLKTKIFEKEKKYRERPCQSKSYSSNLKLNMFYLISVLMRY